MKKYNFRLEQVRRVRQTQEEVAKSALLEANNQVQRAQALVATRMSEYQRAGANYSPMTSNAIFAKERFFNELAGHAVVAARQAAAEAQAIADEKRLAWADAAMKVKVLDRLDERKREEFVVEYNREVDAELDDVVTGRFGIKS